MTNSPKGNTKVDDVLDIIELELATVLPADVQIAEYLDLEATVEISLLNEKIESQNVR